jgi:uncharacterized protein (TIGR03083 family)
MGGLDWSWAGPPLDVRPLFPADRAEFEALLRDLSPGDWQRPTVCPGWRVHDVVAHVVHDQLRKLSGTRDRHAGPGPQPGETLPAWLHRTNQEFVDVARHWSPPVLTGLLSHLGPRLDQLWGSLDMGQAGQPVSWAAPDVPAPAWLDVAREYTEYWVHQQQVRDAVGRPGAEGEQLAVPVTDTFLRAVPYALRHLTPADGTCLAIEVTGPGSGAWTVCRRDRTWVIDRGTPDQRPAAQLRLSSDCLWRVATRGITVEAAEQQAAITGDRELAATALTLVSIIR